MSLCLLLCKLVFNDLIVYYTFIAPVFFELLDCMINDADSEQSVFQSDVFQ